MMGQWSSRAPRPERFGGQSGSQGFRAQHRPQGRYGPQKPRGDVGFHTSRLMFAVHDGKLHFAPPKATYSHAKWFRNQGWVQGKNDLFMENTVRGFIDAEGIYFYVGFDFRVDDDAEKTFFPHIAELKVKLRLPDEFPVYGGMIRTEHQGKFETRKQYGFLADVIKKHPAKHQA
ncbi:hypothetical protein HY772_10450 [Candidatus Woesearchaeota archaeon]|nr:hypothetical protein [Candidatus Woesearchaeota archaeon]